MVEDVTCHFIAMLISSLIERTIRNAGVEGSVFGDGSEVKIEGTWRSGGARGVDNSGGGPRGATSVIVAPDPEPRVDALEPSWGQQTETGAACIVLTPRSGVDPGSELGIAWDLATLEMMSDPRVLGSGEFFCDPAAAAATPRPDAAANAFARSLTLPPPEIRIDPGIALMGLPAHLVLK